MQAALLAHTMLHHPRAWPKQETALGLLITLRKFLQAKWVRQRPPYVRHLKCCCRQRIAGVAQCPCARLASPLTSPCSAAQIRGHLSWKH